LSENLKRNIGRYICHTDHINLLNSQIEWELLQKVDWNKDVFYFISYYWFKF